MPNIKHFLSILDLSAQEIGEVLAEAKRLKQELKNQGRHLSRLDKKILVMIFEKPSLRTKLSFAVGMAQLGGQAVYLGPTDIGLGTRETVADIAKVASSMGDCLMARTFSHETVRELAAHSTVPVINGLSDLEHPCQILADFLTILEIKGRLKDLTLAYVGDGENNITHSLALGCGLLGINFKCASPRGFTMKEAVMAQAKELAAKSGAGISETDDPSQAVAGADIVYTDTWVSMGDENEKSERLQFFKPYQVDQLLMARAKPDAIFMHDLPAYRGNEVAAEVIDGPQSVVFPQAANRLHAQKALILRFLL